MPAIDKIAAEVALPNLATQPGFSTAIVRSSAGLAELRDDWKGLFQRSGCTTIFLTYEWLSQWWKHLGAGHQLFVIAVRDSEGRLVALAPLYISRQGALQIRRLGFLGDNLVGSDYLDVLVDGQVTEALPCLFAAILGQVGEWDYVDLADTVSESHAFTILRPAFESRNLRTEIVPSSVCPFVALPETPDAYRACLTTKFNKHLRYCLRTLERMGTAEFVSVTEGVEIERAFETLLRLHSARASERGSTSTFSDPRVSSFHRGALRELAAAGMARIHLLTLQGTPVAAVYVLLSGTTTFFYQSGLNPEYRRYSAGSLLIRFAIENAIRDRCSEFDFLRGDEPYKAKWANSIRQMHTLRFFDRRPKSRIAYARHRVRRWLHDGKHAMTSGESVKGIRSVLRIFASKASLSRPAKPEEPLV